jgi:hypothetical protein
MKMSLRLLRTAIITVGMLGGVFAIEDAWSESAIQVRTPTIHTPTIHTLTTSTPSSAQDQPTNIHRGTEVKTGAGDNSYQQYPQGVTINSGGSKQTVTIDGKTLPLNKATQKLMSEAATPPPKMWLNGQLVPIN